MNSLKLILNASLVTLSTILAGVTPAMATDPQTLVNVVSDEMKKCPTLDCPGTRVQLAVMTAHDFAAMPKENRAAIREKMTELARDLWPDTILEGPFHVKFNIRVERAEMRMLIVDGQFVGYRIGYSDKAWDMDRCSPMTHPQDKQNLDHCESGRIFDRGFVTNDFSFAFRDESAFTEFKALASFSFDER